MSFALAIFAKSRINSMSQSDANLGVMIGLTSGFCNKFYRQCNIFLWL